MAHPGNILGAHNKQHSLQQLVLLFCWLAPLCGAAGFAANLVRAIDQTVKVAFVSSCFHSMSLTQVT